MKSNAYVNRNFTYEFLETCVRNSSGPCDIPASDAFDREDTPLYVISLPVVRPQETLPLCVLYSLSSALHLYGDTLASEGILSLKQSMLSASSGQLDVPIATCQSLRCPRMRLIAHVFHTSSTYKWTIKALPQYIAQFQPNTGDYGIAQMLQNMLGSNAILLVQLIGVDGGCTHSASFVRSTSGTAFIVDSTESFAMELTDESLSRTCASKCKGWKNAIQFDAQRCLIYSRARLYRSFM